LQYSTGKRKNYKQQIKIQLRWSALGKMGVKQGEKLLGTAFGQKGQAPLSIGQQEKVVPRPQAEQLPGVLGNNDLPPGTHADGGHIFALLWGFRFGWFKGPELTAHGNPPFWKNMIFLTFAVLIVPPPPCKVK
jgi:hypothetical protein